MDDHSHPLLHHPSCSGVIGLISRSLQPAVEAQKGAMGASTKIRNTAINAVDTVKVCNAQADEVQTYEDSVVAATIAYYT